MPFKDKEKKKEYMKQYYQYNKEKINEFRSNNPKYVKSYTIYKWKKRGLIYEDYDKLYDYYLSVEECENCGIELNQDTGTKKCMDHDHNTGEFRNILCMTCNFIRY